MTTAPDLRQMRRWVRSTTRRRLRASRTTAADAASLYNLLLGVVVWAVILWQALTLSSRAADTGPIPRAAVLHSLDPAWLVIGLCLLAAAIAVGALRRLGPLFLRREEVEWLLPLPGRRAGLMRDLARRLTVMGALGGGLLVGVLVKAIDGGTVASVQAAALAAPAMLLGPMLTLRAQVAQRAAGLHAAGLNIDTRALGAILAPPPRRPGQSARLPLMKWVSALPPGQPPHVTGARRRTIAGVVQADLLLLVRQPWRSAALALLALAAGATPFLEIGGRLVTPIALAVLTWMAGLLSVDAARRAQRDDGPDSLWPATAPWVRTGHLVLPALILTCWWGAVGALILLGGAALGMQVQVGFLVVGLLAAPGWAGAALRAGFRRDADWTMLVPTPFGMIPSVLVQAFTTGPDAAMLLVAPLLVAYAGQVGPLLYLTQICLSLVVIAWGLATGRSDTRW